MHVSRRWAGATCETILTITKSLFYFQGFFVPLYYYHTNPNNDDDKLSNIKLAFEYLEDAGFDLKNKRNARKIASIPAAYGPENME